MDTVSQFALGAALGVAVMGRTQSPLKSALIGGVLGTLPDLDSLIDHGDAIANMVQHRAESHSLFWQAIAAPFIATVIALIDRSLSLFFRWWVMTLLVLVTHAGLDAMTVYGTQLLLPLDATPYGVGSIFIIDPLYTLPLLLGLLIVVLGRDRWRWNLAGLVLSSAYLGLTAFTQYHVTSVVRQSEAAAKMPVDQVLVTPTAFNSVLWRIVLIHPDRYEEAFYSVLDPFLEPGRKLRFKAYPRDMALDSATRFIDSGNKIRAFTKGFYVTAPRADGVTITDLRMGQYPYYVFSFEFAKRVGKQFKPSTPVNVGNRSDLPIQAYLRWIWARMLARDVQPPR